MTMNSHFAEWFLSHEDRAQGVCVSVAWKCASYRRQWDSAVMSALFSDDPFRASLEVYALEH